MLKVVADTFVNLLDYILPFCNLPEPWYLLNTQHGLEFAINISSYLITFVVFTYEIVESVFENLLDRRANPNFLQKAFLIVVTVTICIRVAWPLLIYILYEIKPKYYPLMTSGVVAVWFIMDKFRSRKINIPRCTVVEEANVQRRDSCARIREIFLSQITTFSSPVLKFRSAMLPVNYVARHCNVFATKCYKSVFTFNILRRVNKSEKYTKNISTSTSSRWLCRNCRRKHEQNNLKFRARLRLPPNATRTGRIYGSLPQTMNISEYTRTYGL